MDYSRTNLALSLAGALLLASGCPGDDTSTDSTGSTDSTSTTGPTSTGTTGSMPTDTGPGSSGAMTGESSTSGADTTQGDDTTGTGTGTETGTGSGSTTGTMIDCEVDIPATYDDSTALSWVNLVTGTLSQRMYDLLVLDDGRLLVTGLGESHDVTIGEGLASAFTWNDPVTDPFFLAALLPSGEIDWVYVIPVDGNPAPTELTLAPDGTVWFGGLVGSFDEATFTWPDASTQVVMGEIGFRARLDTNGDLLGLWTYDAESVSTLGVAPDGMVVTGGRYWSTEVFGPGEPNETTLNANGGAIDEAYLAKWQPGGLLEWAISLTDGNAEDAVVDLDIDAGGDIFVTGRYAEPSLGGSDPATFGEGAAATVLQPYGEGDGFVARLDANGALLWVRRFGGTDDRDVGTKIRVLPDGSLAVAGFFVSNTAVFGEGEPGETTLPEQGYSTAFLARFAGDGSLLWVRSLGSGSGSFSVSDLELTPAGDIAVLFDTEWDETATVDANAVCPWTLPDDGEMHVLAYSIDGELQWSRHDPWDGGIFNSHSGGIAFDGATGYMSGNFHDATFGPGEPAELSYATNHRDAAVAAFSY